MNVLEVRNLGVSVPSRRAAADTRLVDDVSLDLAAGEVYGIAGPSGCGKTQLLYALMGLSPRGAVVTGAVSLEGRELVGRGAREHARLRGDRIALVFQDPMSALNPYLTVGTQLTEVLRVHRATKRSAAHDAAVEMLDAVHIADPARCLARYPHELSGGMRQRVMISMALLCRPAVLLADEPTTALDVTVQAQVLALLVELAGKFSTAILIVTHDMGVLATVADRVAVMEQGRIVEEGTAEALFRAPVQAATRGLLAAARELALPEDGR